MVARQIWWAGSEVESLCGQTFSAQFTHTCPQRTGGTPGILEALCPIRVIGTLEVSRRVTSNYRHIVEQMRSSPTRFDI